MSDFIPVNVGFNRFAGNADTETILSHIGGENFRNIRGPALFWTPFYILIFIFSFLYPPIIYALFVSIIKGSISGIIILSFFAVFILAFSVWVMSSRQGKVSEELRGASPDDFVHHLDELIEYRQRIVAGDVKIYARRRPYSAPNDLEIQDPSILEADHGILWLFGRERGFALPKNIARPVFQGELLVKATQVSSFMPESLSRIVRLAHADPRGLVLWAPRELKQLERALIVSGEPITRVKRWVRFLIENSEHHERQPNNRQKGGAPNRSTLFSDETWRQIVGGRYPALNEALERAVERLN